MFDVRKPEALGALHEAASRATAPGGEVEVDMVIACATASIGVHAFERAQKILMSALVLAPEHSRAWALLGTTFEQLGRLDEAEHAYESALAFDDRDPVSIVALAALYAKRGKCEQAEALLCWMSGEIENAHDVRGRAAALRRALHAGVRGGRT